MPTPPEHVCFDLGNVICDFDFRHSMKFFSEALDRPMDEIRRAIVFDDEVVAYECGERTTDAYRRTLEARLGVSIEPDTFREGWNSIFEGLRPGMADVIAEVSAAVPVSILSNTNACHMAYWREAYSVAIAPCRHVLVSHELGVRKPDPAAYRVLVETAGVPPDAIWFFDDLEDNVRAARDAGLVAVHVTDEAIVAATLREVGFVR